MECNTTTFLFSVTARAKTSGVEVMAFNLSSWEKDPESVALQKAERFLFSSSPASDDVQESNLAPQSLNCVFVVDIIARSLFYFLSNLIHCR